MKQSIYRDRGQTETKHELLRDYLSAAVPILGSWVRDFCFIDCLAGPWKSVAPDLSDTSFYIASDVLQKAKHALGSRGRTPTFRSLFIEHKAEAFHKLDSFAKSVQHVQATAKRWDFSKHVDDIVNFVRSRPDSFPFFFIDPTGWELASIPLITPILQMRPGEVMINLMSSWIKRFISDERLDFRSLLGEDAERVRALTGDAREEELVRCYSESVRKIGGFDYVCTMPVLKTHQEDFHFHMIYATRHLKGVEVFKQSEKRISPLMHEHRAQAQQDIRLERSGQYSLFKPSGSYPDERYARYKQRNLELARQFATDKFSRQIKVPYDDLWATWMQFACVQEDSLRIWIDEEIALGRLIVLNKPAGIRVLSRKKDIMLKRTSSTS